MGFILKSTDSETMLNHEVLVLRDTEEIFQNS